MIIFGTTSTTKTVETGQFFCPHCQSKQGYQLKRLRRWGHLYWIPIIPLDEVSRWVTCDACHEDFKPVVLEFDPDKQRDLFRKDLATAVNGVIHTLSRRAPLQLEVKRQQVDHFKTLFSANLADTTVSSEQSMRTILSPVADRISDEGKEALLLQMALISIDGSELHTACVEPIIEAANALGLSPAHLRGIVSEAFSFQANETQALTSRPSLPN